MESVESKKRKTEPDTLFQGGRNSTSSSSARHKKGCKCKKSKCLNKHCDCCRDKVGCSKRCRCEDCDNSFGKKPPEPMLLGAEYGKSPSHKMAKTRKLMSHSTKVGTANQFLPIRETPTYMNHLTVSTHPRSSAVPSLTSHYIRDYQNVSQAESEKGTNFHGYSSALISKKPCLHDIRGYQNVSQAESEKGTNFYGYSSALIPKQPSLHNIRDYQNVSQAESKNGTNFHGYSSALIPKQPCPSKEVSSSLSINDIHKMLEVGTNDVLETAGLLSYWHPSFFDDIREMLADDDIPDSIMEDSNPTNTMKSQPPGQPTAASVPAASVLCPPTPTTWCNSGYRMNQTQIDHQVAIMTSEWNAHTENKQFIV